MKKLRYLIAIMALLACVACSEDRSEKPAATPAGQTTNALTAMLDEGIALGKRDKLDEAKAVFRRILAVDRTNKYAWYNLGVIDQQRNLINEAVKDYDRALVADPGYTPAMYNKAIILESRDVDAAIRLYKQVLVVDPKASTTYVRLGLLYVGKGQTDLAGANFAAAIKLDPSLRDAVPAEYRTEGN
jgi:tetratricopeptide (TPR) repeat protein